MRELDELLEEYETRLGLPEFKVTNESEVERLLKLPLTELKRMTAEECGESSYVLEQFSFHLQRAVNREQERVRWCDECVRRLIAPILREIHAYGWEERRIQAVSQDDAVIKLEKIRVLAQGRLDRASFLSTKSERLSKSMLELQQTKRNLRRD